MMTTARLFDRVCVCACVCTFIPRTKRCREQRDLNWPAAAGEAMAQFFTCSSSSQEKSAFLPAAMPQP